jgi:protein MpaA
MVLDWNFYEETRRQLAHSRICYGKSPQGRELEAYVPQGKASYQPDFLICAGVHGDEGETTRLLCEAMLQTAAHRLSAVVILAANPDGLRQATRANAAGVDINRNFPAATWKPQILLQRRQVDRSPHVAVNHAGSHPASETETQFLMWAVETFAPRQIVALHSDLNYIINPRQAPIGQWIAEQVNFPVQQRAGYPITGAMGHWTWERRIPLVTYELGRESMDVIRATHAHVVETLLRENPLAPPRPPQRGTCAVAGFRASPLVEEPQPPYAFDRGR